MLLKTDSTARIIRHGFCMVHFFNISENFLRDIIVFLFIEEVVANFTEDEQQAMFIFEC